MLELPFNMSFRFTKFDFNQFAFAEKLQPQLLGGTVALVAVGLTAAYIYFRKRKALRALSSTTTIAPIPYVNSSVIFTRIHGVDQHPKPFKSKQQNSLSNGDTHILKICHQTYSLHTKLAAFSGCLDPKNFKEFRLIKKTPLSHNVARFRFAFPTPTSVLGLPVGKNILARGRDSQGEEVMRSYTPITLDSDVGYFELVVKMYPNGKMSHHFRQMKEGDYLAVKGPKGRFSYKPGQVRAFGMLAGGSGITPMFQLTRAILENPKDKTRLYLIYANVTVDDILLKEELDSFANKFPDRFQVYHVLNKPPNPWNGGVGFVSKEMIQAHCPAPAQDIQILRCGPPPMNKAMATHLDALGYTSGMQFEF